MLNYYNKGDGTYSHIAEKCLNEYNINRSTTVSITMHEGYYPIAYSFDFSKFYWHITSQIIKTHFPAIFSEIDNKFFERFGEAFPLVMPTPEQKAKINSFIGCLSSTKQGTNYNPFPHTKYGELIRKQGFTCLELVIKEFERNYNCKVIGAQTDGFYFTCSKENFAKLKENFQHNFSFKLDELYDLNATDKTWFWTDASGVMQARGAMRRLIAMCNGDYYEWCIIHSDGHPKIKIFIQHDIELNRWKPESKYVNQGKFISFFRDDELFKDIKNSFKELSNTDKLFFATELTQVLEQVFYDKKSDSYIIASDVRKQVSNKVRRICKKVILDADGKIKFNRVDVPSFQIIKRSFFVDELFDKYINIENVPDKGSIISAPCGSGKSYSMCNYMINHVKKGCIVEPTKSIAQQIMVKYGINYLRSSNIEDWDGENDLNPLQTFSYSNNQLNYFLRNTVFADEMHSCLWFKEYYETINRCIYNGVGVTATVPPLYDYVSKVYSFYSLTPKKAKVRFHLMQMEKKEAIIRKLIAHICNNVKNGINSFLYYDDKDALQCIKNELHKNGINDIIIYARSVVENEEDGELGFNTTAEYVEACASGSHRVILSTLRGITGVDFTFDNLNTIIFSKDIINTVQACSRDRIAPNCDVYVNCHYHYNDNDKLYTYYAHDGGVSSFDHDKHLINSLNSSAKYLDVLISMLKQNGFEDFKFINYDAPQKVKTNSLKKSEFIDFAVQYYTDGTCQILNDEAERKFINAFNASASKYRHDLKIKITYKQLFDLFKEDFEYWKSNITYSNNNKIISTSNIFIAIAIKVLSLKVDKLKLVRGDRAKGKRVGVAKGKAWSKKYPRDFIDYLKVKQSHVLSNWMKKWKEDRRIKFYYLCRSDFDGWRKSS